MVASIPIFLFATVASPAAELKEIGEGPVDFRCDSGQGFTKPNRFICRDNVIVRRGDLVLCCRVFEGYTDDAGGWQRFTCTQDVRAQRGDEVMWAHQATFILSVSDLILTGRPRLRRGKSILEGERIVVDTKYDRAHIMQPRGRMQPATGEAATTPSLPLEGPLPSRCPVPGAPSP